MKRERNTLDEAKRKYPSIAPTINKALKAGYEIKQHIARFNKKGGVYQHCFLVMIYGKPTLWTNQELSGFLKTTITKIDDEMPPLLKKKIKKVLNPEFWYEWGDEPLGYVSTGVYNSKGVACFTGWKPKDSVKNLPFKNPYA